MSGSPVWLAVVISSNVGLHGEIDLHYADEDALELASVLTEVGGFTADNVFHVSDARPDDVTDALSAAVLRSSALREAGHPTRLLVYYTGHAGSDGLHLHDQVMPLPSLKTAARVVPAEERVFAVDACQSGTLFRTKGATLVSVDSVPPEFQPPEDEAWITSSGAEEQAFEVDQRRGSLFTHFFVSALRGAADADANRQVTLNETFRFVADQTTDAAARIGQRQTPRWENTLGDLVLTDLSREESGVELVGPIGSPLLVVDRNTARVVAEMPVGGGGHLALPAGRYQVLALERSRKRVRDLLLARGQVARVEVASLKPAPGVRSKGGILVDRPWRLGVGAVGMVGAVPGQAPGVGGAIRLDRELGRGHDLGVVFTGLFGQVETEHARISNRRLDLAVDWSVDAAWRSIRVGPGVRIGGGWLHQVGTRRDDGLWGSWYGEPDPARSFDYPTASALGLGRLVVPLGRFEAHATLGLGAGVIAATTPRIEPLAQLGLGLNWSFR